MFYLFHKMMDKISTNPGTYALLMLLKKETTLPIGKRGIFDFQAGHYLYLGSAQGPGGLRARLGRHFSDHKEKQHWHIDWLLPYVSILTGYLTYGQENFECSWCQACAAIPSAQIPVRRFGATDCTNGCHAHLLFFPVQQSILSLPSILRKISQSRVRIITPGEY
jgi:Uri superfamily endonuclease